MKKISDVVNSLWDTAASYLPKDLDALARETGAVKRFRTFGNGLQLLRAELLCASANSFRVAAELASMSGLVDVSAEALFYRMNRSEDYLERILLHLVHRLNVPAGCKVVAVDGTSLSGPASKGADWRVHVGYGPVRGIPCSVVLTDSHAGESLRRHSLQPGWLVLADMGYGTARNIHAAFEAGSDMLIRVPKSNIRLLDASGKSADWKAMDGQVPATGPASFSLSVPVPPDGVGSGWSTKKAIAHHPIRLIGIRNPLGVVVWLATNMSEERLSNEDAGRLYRVRWQIELFFKRLKSLGDLDVLNSREGPTAKAALLAKLILLMLANLISNEEQALLAANAKRSRKDRSLWREFACALKRLVASLLPTWNSQKIVSDRLRPSSRKRATFMRECLQLPLF
jgi:hypothetical protein